jgi:hypothetical protein
MACCDKQGCETRTEAMLDASMLATAAESGVAIISKLMEIAATGGGIMYLFKDNPKLNELAAMINSLATENQYLKKKLGEEVVPTVAADDVELLFTFGPKNAYSLRLPAFDPASRSALAGQLVRAAAELMGTNTNTKSLPGQQIFPFAEE